MQRLLSVLMATKPARLRQFAPLRPGAPSEKHGRPELQGIVFGMFPPRPPQVHCVLRTLLAKTIPKVIRRAVTTIQVPAMVRRTDALGPRQDVDGTLCKPQNYMFKEMRSVLGIDKTVDILDHIYSLPTPEQQETAMESIRAIERAAMVKQTAQPGLVELMAYLDSRGVRKAICTRNFQQPVAHLLASFLAGSVFEPVITREFRPPKPDPAGILHIARSWGLVRDGDRKTATSSAGARDAAVAAHPDGDATNLIMVGDSADDMAAGRRAGAATVLLVNQDNAHLAEYEDTDLVISRLDELILILEDGFEGQATESTGSSGSA